MTEDDRRRTGTEKSDPASPTATPSREYETNQNHQNTKFKAKSAVPTGRANEGNLECSPASPFSFAEASEKPATQDPCCATRADNFVIFMQ
jgi:hypothetical protein